MDTILTAYAWTTAIAVALSLYLGLGDLVAFRRAGQSANVSAVEVFFVLALACLPVFQLAHIVIGVVYLGTSIDPISNVLRRVFRARRLS